MGSSVGVMQGTKDRIERHMDATGHTVTSLADATAIPRMTLTRRLTDPSTLTLAEVERIAGALDVTALYLLTGSEDAA